MLFVVALKIEAGVLIKKYNLKKIENKYFSIFEGDGVALILSGVGATRASIATTYIITLYPKHNQIINFGGAGSQKLPIGTIHQAKSILYDDKKYMIADTGVTLKCTNKPIVAKHLKTNMVDMESFGVYQVCRVFKRSLRIVKIITDKCEKINYEQPFMTNKKAILDFDFDSKK